MPDNLFLKLSKILVLGLFLFNVIGCGNTGATSAQSKPAAGSTPAKAENRLTGGNDKAVPVKTETADAGLKTDTKTEKGKENSKVNEKTGSSGSKKENRTASSGETDMNLKTESGYRNGDSYLAKYQDNPAVRQMILVEQSAAERSAAKLFLLVKEGNGRWHELLQCKALLGKNGIDKTREGDARTPTGDYGMLMAFGAKDDPGSLVPYTKLTDTMYLCGDKEYYNRFIDVSKVKHTCSNNSEHLIRYIPQYNYALFFDYNKDNIYGKGSAIFLHCFGSYPYTMGCVSVSEENMVKILKTVDTNARICIYPYK